MRRRRVDNDVQDELEFHIAMRARDNERAGMSPGEARRAAEQRFGDRERIGGQVARLTWSDEPPRRTGTWVGGLLRDLHMGTRTLLRRPAFACAVVLTLALGIGATTAIFTLARFTILRPVPGIPAQEGLVSIRFIPEGGRSRWPASHRDFVDLQAGAPALEGLAASVPVQAHAALPGTDRAQRVGAELVSANYFEVLGVRAVRGRALSGEAGDPRVVMVSHAFWRETLGGRADAVGEVVVINGLHFTVVGVAPPGFRGPGYPETDAALWVPIESHRDLMPAYPDDLMERRNAGIYFTAYGRLGRGMGSATAEAQLRAAAAALADEYGRGSTMNGRLPTLAEHLGLDPDARARASTMISMLMGTVALLLLLAVANSANLLLARAEKRSGEMALRRALGAGRGAIVRQLMTEGLLLGLVSAAAGLGVGWLTLRLFAGERLGRTLPVLHGLQMDGAVLLVALATAILAAILFSVGPALLAAMRAGAAPASGARTVAGRSRFRTGLVVTQVALSLTLVTGAGLLLDTVRALNGLELGFDPEGVLEFSVDPGTQGYGDQQLVEFWQSVLRDGKEAEGVHAVGLSWLPLQGRSRADSGVWPVGTDEEMAEVSGNAGQVSHGFLAAAGIDLLEGRDFLPSEVLAATPPNVLIVSRSVADGLFPGGSAVGRSVHMSFRGEESYRIVGVSADASMFNVKEGAHALLLEPLGQSWTPGYATVYLRGSGDAPPSVATAANLVAALDSNLPIFDVQTLRRRVAESLGEDRLLARFMTLFAGLALLLAAVGIYGVVMLDVQARERDLGVRLALGARPERIREMVLKQGVATTLAGVLVGVVGAGWMARVLATRLWGVAPLDTLVFATAAALLLAVGGLASWLPAWRATRVDPAAALRAE